MERLDLAIIGTGPAGLSAALTAKNRNLNFALFGSQDLSLKVAKAHKITNYPGLPDVTGEQMAEAFKNQLDAAGIPIRSERIGSVYSMGDYFALQVGQDMIEASSVILATGVSAGKKFAGEDENLGKGVSYCATCDAAIYRNRPVIVIGANKKEEEEAAFLSEVCSSVTYFPLYNEETELPESVTVIREKPVSITREENRSMTLATESGNTYNADCIFVLRESVSAAQLVPGLETDGPHVKVDRSMAASIPGLFAAGDITGTPYQYIKSAGEGNVAAISAAGYLTMLKKNAK